MSQPPKLSIVVTSRNDDHGGQMFKRMTIFMKGLLYQTRKFQVPLELVFVEWNPPAGPLLHEVLPCPQAGDYLTVRYVVVPPAIHDRYKMGKQIPLFQMIAKNVGIRRAKCDFILCSNVDLLFSDDLMKTLRDGSFDKGTYYRANRCEVPNAMEAAWEEERVLAFCRNNVIKHLGKQAGYEYLGDWPERLPKNKLTLGVLNWFQYLKLKYFDDSIEFRLRPLDAEACGDFTMMHRNAWEEIQGYLELDLYSLHIDTFALMMALILDYKQVVFPAEACTYHMEHGTGWESMNPVEKIKFWERRPGLSHDFIWEAAKYMLYENKAFHINDADWGMAREDLQEITLKPQ